MFQHKIFPFKKSFQLKFYEENKLFSSGRRVLVDFVWLKNFAT